MQTYPIAIIGAGMAGLAAARRLTQAGRSVVILEKSRGVGGRVASRRIEDCLCDHGAQVLKPDGHPLADVMLRELPTDGLIQVTAPTRLWRNDGTLLPTDANYESERKFAYREGLTTLPKLLLQDLPPERFALRRETRIVALEETPDGIALCAESGEIALTAAQVIVTAPAPQSADLLAASRRQDPQTAARIEALRSVAYSSCLTVLLAYAPPVPEPPAYALLAEDRSQPLLWLAFEQTKAPERAPGGKALLIAQLGAEFSAERYDRPDAEIVAWTLQELRRLFGTDYANPLWSQVKHWHYSQPRGMARFEEVNPPGSPILICGDALRPENGRVHQAYSSGLEAAERLLQTV